MSLRNRIFLFFSLSALAVLAACGGSSGKPIIPTPPPSGGFTNSSLNGTYTFSISGANGNGLFAMAGSFVACGCSQGSITSGTIDIVDPTGAQPQIPLLTSSVYSISADGRGTAQLFFNTAAILNYEMDVDFVLTSSSHGLIIRYDQNGTGSGTIDLQDPSLSQSQLASQFYAFSVSGGDFSNRSLASVGEFQLDSTGAITAGTGFADFNYNAVPYSETALTGSLVVGSGITPGTATLNAPTFSASPLVFDVYAVDSTHLKLIESDGISILVGDALISPTNAFPSGNLAFNMAGPDTGGNLMVMGGIMASNISTGASTGIISSGFEDVNDNGLVDNGTNTVNNFSGTLTESPSGSGRWVVTLANFIGGATFVAYPFNGGLVMLEADTGLNAGVSGGSALVQQSGLTDLAASGYGLNVSGADLNVVPATEADEIAEFKASSGNLTGTIDINDGGSLATVGLTGTYGASPVGSFTGTGAATLQAGFAGMFYYLVDDSTALFISTDSTLPGLGSMQVQTTPSSAAAKSVQTPRLIPMPHLVSHQKSAMNPHRKTTLVTRKITVSKR